MTLTIKLKKPVHKVKTTPQSDVTQAPSKLRDLIEEAGKLKANAEKAATMKKKASAMEKPYKDVLKKIQAELAGKGYDPDAADTVLSESFSLEYGKASKNREVTSTEDLLKHMSDELFMKLATVKIGDIDDYLTPDQKEDCIVTKRGDRSLKLEKRA